MATCSATNSDSAGNEGSSAAITPNSKLHIRGSCTDSLDSKVGSIWESVVEVGGGTAGAVAAAAGAGLEDGEGSEGEERGGEEGAVVVAVGEDEDGRLLLRVEEAGSVLVSEVGRGWMFWADRALGCVVVSVVVDVGWVSRLVSACPVMTAMR